MLTHIADIQCSFLAHALLMVTRGYRVKGEDAMRIDAGTSALYVNQRQQASASSRSAAPAVADVLNTTKADSTKQVDFTNMTRQQMRDWVNTQIRSGEMSLDDSFPFMAMTINIPADGSTAGELPAELDNTRYDFTRKARDGIAGSISRGDTETLKMLESALSIMQRQQGQTIGINIRA